MSERPPPVTVRLPNGATVTVGGATLAEQRAELDRVLAAWEAREARRQLVRDLKAGWATIEARWAGIKNEGAAWLNATPPLDLLQRTVFLYQHQRNLTQWLGQVGDDLGAVGDVVVLMIDAIDGLLDEETVEVIME